MRKVQKNLKDSPVLRNDELVDRPQESQLVDRPQESQLVDRPQE